MVKTKPFCTIHNGDAGLALVPAGAVAAAADFDGECVRVCEGGTEWRLPIARRRVGVMAPIALGMRRKEL